MEVKREKTDQGFIKYVVFDNNHEVVNSDRIKITSPYDVGSNGWSIVIPDLRHQYYDGGYDRVTIYRGRNLREIKEVLSKFSTKEELFGFYYVSRLENKAFMGGNV